MAAWARRESTSNTSSKTCGTRTPAPSRRRSSPRSWRTRSTRARRASASSPIPADATLTIVDDGRGMQRRELARYHDVAASTKARGEGIGFAGVGIKLGLLVSREVVTETRRGATHVATRWHLASRHRAPWKWIPPPGLTASRGTAVRLTLDEPVVALARRRLSRGDAPATFRAAARSRVRRPAAAALSATASRSRSTDGRCRARTCRVPNASRSPIRLGRRRTPSAIGFIERNPRLARRSRRHRDQHVRQGHQARVGLARPRARRARAHISGLIEAPDLAACLTLSKNDFIRTGARGASYLAYRKAIQEVVSRQLAEWGDARDAEARPRTVAARARPRARARGSRRRLSAAAVAGRSPRRRAEAAADAGQGR